MSWIVTGLRRSLWLALVAAAGGAAWAWWRDRTDPATPAPAEWPPLQPSVTADMLTPAGTSSVVNALIDAPDARSAATSGNWVTPDDDGSCPLSHPVKANDNSGIFHEPGGRFHERTKAERCYSTADAAIADGYRRAKH